MFFLPPTNRPCVALLVPGGPRPLSGHDIEPYSTHNKGGWVGGPPPPPHPPPFFCCLSYLMLESRGFALGTAAIRNTGTHLRSMLVSNQHPPLVWLTRGRNPWRMFPTRTGRRGRGAAPTLLGNPPSVATVQVRTTCGPSHTLRRALSSGRGGGSVVGGAMRSMAGRARRYQDDIISKPNNNPAGLWQFHQAYQRRTGEMGCPLHHGVYQMVAPPPPRRQPSPPPPLRPSRPPPTTDAFSGEAAYSRLTGVFSHMPLTTRLRSWQTGRSAMDGRTEKLHQTLRWRT